MALSLAYWLGLVHILMAPAVAHSQMSTEVPSGWSATSFKNDLGGRMFSMMSDGVITLQGSSSPSNIDAITTCLRMVTDPMQRDMNIFTLKMANTISVMKSYLYVHRLTLNEQSVNLYPMLVVPLYKKLYPWTSLCVTWDSDTGMSQMWRDGLMSSRKGIGRKLKFSGKPVMTISGFEGQLTDIHVWDKVLPLSSLDAFYRGDGYPYGNLLSWRNMTYTSKGYVVLEDAYQIPDKLTKKEHSGKHKQRLYWRRGDEKWSPGRSKKLNTVETL